jgi:glycosyltransferase involved in cell wall biosynthesis
MHILHVNTEKGWRGGERQTLLSMEGLRDAGIETTLLCLNGRPLHKRAIAAGFPVIPARSQLSAFWYLLRCGRNYSIVHAQSSRAFGSAALASFFMRTPVVYTRRVDFVPAGRLTKWKYQRATALVSVSGRIAEILQKAGMGRSEVIGDIVTEPAGTGVSAESMKMELGVSGMKIVGVVAAFVGHKDPFTMVRAAETVTGRLPGTVFLHLGEGPLLPAVRRECEKRGFSSSYRLLGFRNNIEDYFPLFDCFAMSSSEEGLGSSVLDAFIRGIPVASTSAGGLGELVGERGLLSPPGDPDMLAENIIRLLNDSSLVKALAQGAREYALRGHGLKVITGRYLDLYRKVTGETLS